MHFLKVSISWIVASEKSCERLSAPQALEGAAVVSSGDEEDGRSPQEESAPYVREQESLRQAFLQARSSCFKYSTSFDYYLRREGGHSKLSTTCYRAQYNDCLIPWALTLDLKLVRPAFCTQAAESAEAGGGQDDEFGGMMTKQKRKRAIESAAVVDEEQEDVQKVRRCLVYADRAQE